MDVVAKAGRFLWTAHSHLMILDRKGIFVITQIFFVEISLRPRLIVTSAFNFRAMLAC